MTTPIWSPMKTPPDDIKQYDRSTAVGLSSDYRPRLRVRKAEPAPCAREVEYGKKIWAGALWIDKAKSGVGSSKIYLWFRRNSRLFFLALWR